MRPSHGTASGVERLRRHLPLSGWVGVVAWLGTRSVMALVLATLCLYVREDVGYYAVQLQSVPMLRSHGLGGTLVEYPVPAVWLLEALRVPAGASSAVYVYAFALLMVLLDTFCCWALWTHHSRLGPLLWFRIGLVPAVCALPILLLVHVVTGFASPEEKFLSGRDLSDAELARYLRLNLPLHVVYACFYAASALIALVPALT